ncbi:MAG: hypothetical protein GC185_00390 [Alphaproteobacteria bacterium]|nr:hypothetical protein [Alphaproteobacteria bacterium]
MCLIALLPLCACVPTGDQNVNTELFKNKDDMQKRAGDLHRGMSEKNVFKTLGIERERFARMSMEEVQMSIYGNSQVQGTPAQLEKFRKHLLQCKGYSLPYSKIKSDSSLGFGTMKIEKTGYSLKLVLIFEHGKLLQSSVEGTENVKQEESQYLWDTLIRRGIGLPF